jgi:tetratricopeptide (TPR) repeat protein
MSGPTPLSANVERSLVAISIALVLAGAAVCIQPECFPTADQRLVKQILAALESRHAGAYELAREYASRPASRPFAIALAAESAAINFQSQPAIDLYRQLPVDGGRWEFFAELGMARRCEIMGRVTEAERHLRRALELSPYDIEANSRLGHVLQISGRNWEAIPHFFILIRRGKCRGDELVGFAAPERFYRADDRQEEIARFADQPDALLMLARARRALFENQQAESEALLREVISAAPQLGEAHGRLGRIIHDRGDAAEFLQWRGSLPTGVRNHPEVWFVQGLQARRLGQIEGAVRCFLETLNQSPNHLAASVQIAGCLDQLNRPDLAAEFVRHGESLAKLESLLNILRNDTNPKFIHETIASLAGMGRFWEAAGWSYVMTHLEEVDKSDARRDVRRWLKLARQDAQQNAVSFNPASKLRLSDFAEPRWIGTASPGTPVSPLPVDDIPWSFQDDAGRVGISFRYFEGTTEATRLQHIFNVVGGGLAAADYDLDGWPDLYLAQANNWRDPSPQPDYPDRLFRNLPGQPFQDVTVPAGLGDLNFTHGVTVGDFNQDGFPDLYLGNLGPNRLYLNNGDGTFIDVTAAAGVAGNEWTTSSVFADFNADGLPDLYVANYSLIDETAKKLCKRANGEPMACTPDVLTAEFHRFHLNSGDGSFRDVTAAAGLRQPNGRGLGLVAWDFGGDGRLGLFVGNDTSANFLFINEGNGPDGTPRFREEAVIRGVAFDVDGNAQACMGVAAGDANGDGRIDMYVTNFFGESDTLYSQRADGMFDDATRPFALRDAGYWTLGFGCQFADFDGDGWEDLIATNGHVDQQSRRGDPDRTPPQLFRNRHGRKFDEIAPAKLGAFFQKGYLGRGLAKLDWNRDGRVDFAVSHLHDPFALVTNNTPSSGLPLIVRLAGRTGTREPTGAVVKLRAGDREMFRLLTAGDGYLVTNDRFVHFAVPPTEPVVELEVHWPRGGVERWTNVRAGGEILLIEGRKQPVVLRTYDEAATRLAPGRHAGQSASP